MANLIGPSFYAGFLDIGALPDAERLIILDLRQAMHAWKRVIAYLRREAVAVGLGFYETTFLTMQRKIFEDQALMHEAFLGGGLPAIDALGAAGLIDRSTVRAWHQIASGDEAEIESGNRTLLFREQYDIIDRFYDDMRAYSPPLGHWLTYTLTFAAVPAVPGARAYADVFPLAVAMPIADRRFALSTPSSRRQPGHLRRPLAPDSARHAAGLPASDHG
jgi:hypothetical protein